jgi:hypothetical protein
LRKESSKDGGRGGCNQLWGEKKNHKNNIDLERKEKEGGLRGKKERQEQGTRIKTK